VSDAPDHLPYRPGLNAVFDVVHRLRAPGGCPWDREQTHESLRPYLLEEAYEVLEAIDSGSDEKLREELGDLLLQVAMHAEIAAEDGRFDAGGVSESVAAKMVARHPHVFGDVEVADAEEVLRNWERQKAKESRDGEHASVLDRVPRSLPALAWALALQKRAARVGFSFTDEAAAEVPEPPVPEEVFNWLGDVLFALVNVARMRKVNPEDALRVAGRRFRDRFAALEQTVRERGIDMHDLTQEELSALWSATGPFTSRSAL
jgi:MazG family protein